MLNQPNSTNKPTDIFFGREYPFPIFSPCIFPCIFWGTTSSITWRTATGAVIIAVSWLRFLAFQSNIRRAVVGSNAFLSGNVNFPRRQRCNKCPGKLELVRGGLEERIFGEVDLKQMKGANEYMFFVITYSLGSLSMCNLIKTHQILP